MNPSQKIKEFIDGMVKQGVKARDLTAKDYKIHCMLFDEKPRYIKRRESDIVIEFVLGRAMFKEK